MNYLRHSARTYMFSASNTPAATAAAKCALDIIKSEPERIKALWDVTNYALGRFKEEGFEIGDTESPIIPLYIRDMEKTFAVTAMAFERGVFINPVVPPACAPSDTLVRYALMATHTKEQVDRSVEILKGIFKELDIIKQYTFITNIAARRIFPVSGNIYVITDRHLGEMPIDISVLLFVHIYFCHKEKTNIKCTQII